jgi:hypothetical protein
VKRPPQFHWKHARGSKKSVRVALVDDAGQVVLQAAEHDGAPALVVDDSHAKLLKASPLVAKALRDLVADVVRCANDPQFLRTHSIPTAQRVLREVGP